MIFRTDHERKILIWIYAIDPSYISPLMENYREEAQIEDVKKTFFESTTLEKDNESALGESGFSLKSVEGMDIDVTVDECKALSIARKDAPPHIQSISLLSDQQNESG